MTIEKERLYNRLYNRPSHSLFTECVYHIESLVQSNIECHTVDYVIHSMIYVRTILKRMSYNTMISQIAMSNTYYCITYYCITHWYKKYCKYIKQYNYIYTVVYIRCANCQTSSKRLLQCRILIHSELLELLRRSWKHQYLVWIACRLSHYELTAY